MSNKYKTQINNEKKITRHNEEETTAVEIDKILDSGVNMNDTQKNVTENKDCSNDDLNKKNVKQNLDTKRENVIIKSDGLEQKNTVLQLVEKDRKPPSIWIQCSLLYGSRTPQQQLDGLVPFSYNSGSGNHFVKFVFILLLVMLAITADCVVLVLMTDSLKQFYQLWGVIIIFVSSFVLISINFVMGGSLAGTLVRADSGRARVLPCNYIFMFIGVIAMSNVVAALSVLYGTNNLVLAIIATLITVFQCILLACSSFDFTTWYIYVAVIVMVFMAILLVISIEILAMGIEFRANEVASLFGGTLIHVIILTMELQLILGRQTIEIGEGDFALATYLLYAPMVDLFMQILRLFRFGDD